MRILGKRALRWRVAAAEVGPLQDISTLDEKSAGVARLAHLSDFHFGKPLDEDTVPAVVDRWLSDLGEVDVDVIVFSGDLVEEPGDRAAMLRMKYRLDDSGVPWVIVPGNHDIVCLGSDGAFYEIFGAYPRVESHAGVDFVLLDSIGGLPAAERGPFDRLQAIQSGAYSKGRVGRRQLERAAEMLAGRPSRARVLVVHHHLREESEVLADPPPPGAPGSLMEPLLDHDELVEWALDHDVRLAFHGHKHAHWPPYLAAERLPVFNSGSSTRGKPVRRARIVDLALDGSRAGVWEIRE